MTSTCSPSRRPTISMAGRLRDLALATRGRAGQERPAVVLALSVTDGKVAAVAAVNETGQSRRPRGAGRAGRLPARDRGQGRRQGRRRPGWRQQPGRRRRRRSPRCGRPWPGSEPVTSPRHARRLGGGRPRCGPHRGRCLRQGRGAGVTGRHADQHGGRLWRGDHRGRAGGRRGDRGPSAVAVRRRGNRGAGGAVLCRGCWRRAVRSRSTWSTSA